MYTLLIVDDEPYLADSLYNTIIHSDKTNLDVFKAYSAVQALEIIKNTRIDIVLSDICMPGINGLEFLNQIQLYWPYCKVIFLTGFDNFEYVQTALRSKAVDFILKAEGDKPIFEALTRAVNEIEDERKNTQYIENATKQMRRALPLLQNKYLLDVVSGFESCVSEMQIQFDDLKLPFQSNMPVQIIIGQVDYWPKDLSLTRKMESLYRIQNVAEHYLSPTACVVPVVCNYNKLLWITQPKGSFEDKPDTEGELVLLQRVSQFVYNTIYTIQQKIHETLHIPVSFAICKNPVFWEFINTKYNHLEKLLQKVSGITSEVILSDDKLPTPHISTLEREEKKYRQKVYSALKKAPLLETYLESGQVEDFSLTLKEMLESIDSEKLNSYILARKVYYSIAMIFLNYIEQLDKEETMILEECFQLDKLMKIEAHSSWKDITDYFIKLAQGIFNQKSNEYMESTNKIIQHIHSYIQQNLGNDISLNKLAEVCHFNPFYLSRLYKQATGKSISEYISDFKLEKAREFLKHDNIRINEITSSLGFANASYFARFFKKYTNMTPQEYRDSLL